MVFISGVCQADTWKSLRTSGGGSQGWQAVVCENGAGWRVCELPVNISLTASPPSLVANGQYSTITATVTDYYGVPIPNNVINWSTSDGTISAGQTSTNASGQTSISLRSSWTLGGAAVYASTAENDGTAGIWVPFVDSFVAYPSDYTGWTAYNAVYGCGAWSPDVSTVDSGTWFTQWATCYQNYYRYRQDRQQSIVTGAITNVGGQVAEYTSSTVGVSQSAVGTRYVAPPTPPTPPPSATTCSFMYDGTQPIWYFWTSDPDGAHYMVTTETMNDYMAGNYDAGVFAETSNVHGTQVWSGYLDYKGFRYTSGKFIATYAQAGPNAYFFELCKTPL
jgi:hypothetical protein